MHSLWTWLFAILMMTGPLVATDASPVAADSSAIQPLLIGAAIPSITVQDEDGKAINLADYIKEKPTVLIFYRGSWCPFCVKQLAQLKDLVPELDALGYRFTAITQDSPEINSKTQAKHKFGFPILSDSNMSAAKGFGLAFKIDEDTRSRYKGYGIDLVGLYGRTKPLMAVPGVFLFNAEGKIRFAYVNPDYRMRLAPEIILAAAKSK